MNKMKGIRKKYQVFVSSTYEDLIDERQAIIISLLKAGCIPSGMELFAASDDEQWGVIKDVIEESDYFILVIAGKYGSEHAGKSYTQMEYEYAVSKNKKIICFLYKDIDSLPSRFTEIDVEKRVKLNKFRNQATKRMCYFWENKDILALEVYHAIAEAMKKHKQNGWVRATRYNLTKLSEARNKNLLRKLERASTENKILKNKYTDLKEDGLHGLDFRDYLSLKTNEMDKRVNAIYPEKFYSPTKDAYVDFSSRSLIDSLVVLGIPVEVCFDITKSTLRKLEEIKGTMPQVSTDTIRGIVSSLLYDYSINLKSNNFDWEDKYIKKYGDPDKRMNVVLDISDNIKPLDFNYIKRTLLPDMFSSIIYGIKGDSFIKTLRANELSGCAEIILEAIKKLDVDELDYEFLIYLSRQYAIRLPHPWITPRDCDRKYVGYDYDKSRKHVRNLLMQHESKVKTDSHAMKEFIHHSCSGILAIYGAYRGARFMASLNYLMHYLTLNDERAEYLNEYTSFNVLRIDLVKLNTSQEKLLNVLSYIKNHTSKVGFVIDISEETQFNTCILYIDLLLQNLVDLYFPEIIN